MNRASEERYLKRFSLGGAARLREMSAVKTLGIALLVLNIAGCDSGNEFRRATYERIKLIRHCLSLLVAEEAMLADGGRIWFLNDNGIEAEELGRLLKERVPLHELRNAGFKSDSFLDGYGRPFRLEFYRKDGEWRLLIRSLGKNGRDDAGHGDDVETSEWLWL